MLKEHLKNRHLDLSRHKVWLDEEKGVATFPLTDLCGKMLGYQLYRPSGDKSIRNSPNGKYYTYTTNENFHPWGMESWSFSNTLFLTEGLFDAARLTERGYSALAMLSNNPKQWWSVFKFFMMIRPTVVVADNDAAGKYLVKYGQRHVFAPEGYDLNSAPDEWVNELLEGVE